MILQVCHYWGHRLLSSARPNLVQPQGRVRKGGWNSAEAFHPMLPIQSNMCVYSLHSAHPPKRLLELAVRLSD